MSLPSWLSRLSLSESKVSDNSGISKDIRIGDGVAYISSITPAS